MKKSILTPLLLLMIVLSMLLTACNGNNNPSEQTKPATDGGTTTGGGGTPTDPDQPGRYVANVPDASFNGEKIVFLTRNSECGDFETWDLLQTDLQRDSMNSAIVARNNYIEQTYDVEIAQRQFGAYHGDVCGGGMYTAIYNNYTVGSTSGEDAFHVAFCGVKDAIMLAASGIFYDLSELPYINLSAPWWDADAMSSLTIADRNFFGVGDLSVQLNETLGCLVFNKGMAKSYTDLDLYRMVDDGEWTYDAFYSIIKEVYTDTDDVTGPSVGDTFGAGGQTDNLFNFFYASGCRTVTVNRNGDPELTIYSENNERVFSKLYDMLTDREAFFNCVDYVNVPGWISSPIEFVTSGFLGGRMLFYSDGLLHLPEFRDATFEFGILPCPKYTEEQETYFHLIGSWGATVITVPVNCPDVKMTTTILEAMGAESKNTVSPEYVEGKLGLQSVRDSESAASLNIIIATKGFDMGQCFRWNDLHQIMSDCLSQRNNSFYANYQAKEQGIRIEINKTIASYQSLPHYIELED